MTTSVVRLRHRPARALPAGLVAGLLTAAGALSVLLSIWWLIQRGWPEPIDFVATALAGTAWSSPVVLATAAVVAVLGLMSVVAGCLPGRFAVVPLDVDAQSAVATEFVISRRALVRLAAAAAERFPGVDAVESATGSAARIRLRVRSRSARTQGLAAAVRQRVQTTLADARVRDHPRIDVTVRTANR